MTLPSGKVSHPVASTIADLVLAGLAEGGKVPLAGVFG
jgi:hypothetical protein